MNRTKPRRFSRLRHAISPDAPSAQSSNTFFARSIPITLTSSMGLSPFTRYDVSGPYEPVCLCEARGKVHPIMLGLVPSIHVLWRFVVETPMKPDQAPIDGRQTRGWSAFADHDGGESAME